MGPTRLLQTRAEPDYHNGPIIALCEVPVVVTEHSFMMRLDMSGKFMSEMFCAKLPLRALGGGDVWTSLIVKATSI